MAKNPKEEKAKKAPKADKAKKVKKTEDTELPDNLLPQNILPMGERVEENKNIYISQRTYKRIRKFTKNKLSNESGGMLIGRVVEEMGKTNIIISGFVEAKYCEATPTTLKFTHETWEYVHSQIDSRYKGRKIVGWIHTHPDFGIFLSEYDKFIHENFFSEAHQVAYVIDPIQKIEGFYFWINGALERCKGFYIFDKTGVPIDIETPGDEPEETKRGSVFSFKNILIALLSVAVAFLIFANISANKQIKQLQTQQDNLVNSANQALAMIQQEVWQQSAEMQELRDILTEAGIIVEPTVPETTDETTGQTTDETTGETTSNEGGAVNE